MIRSELDVLLDKVQDPALRADLRSQIDRLKQKRSFGLVFEQHIPERVRLPQHPIRLGSQVVSRDGDDGPTFEVVKLEDGVATLVQVRDADGAYVRRGAHEVGGQERAPLASLVVISDFGEPVLPGFRHIGSVERGGDKPYHVIINGENHHALEALRFTHAGKVDCIYIDPPYNSGARDWKYNNPLVVVTHPISLAEIGVSMRIQPSLASELVQLGEEPLEPRWYDDLDDPGRFGAGVPECVGNAAGLQDVRPWRRCDELVAHTCSDRAPYDIADLVLATMGVRRHQGAGRDRVLNDRDTTRRPITIDPKQVRDSSERALLLVRPDQEEGPLLSSAMRNDLTMSGWTIAPYVSPTPPAPERFGSEPARSPYTVSSSRRAR